MIFFHIDAGITLCGRVTPASALQAGQTLSETETISVVNVSVVPEALIRLNETSVYERYGLNDLSRCIWKFMLAPCS